MYLLKSGCMWVKEMGFDNLADLLKSSLLLKVKFIPAWVLGCVGSVGNYFVTHINFGIDLYIFSPSTGIYIFAVATIVDFITGIIHSYFVKSEKITGDKMLRGFIRFFFGLFVVGTLYNMHLVWPVTIQRIFVDGILVAFCMATLWSATQNAYKLKWVDENIYEGLRSILDIKKWFQNKFNKNENDKHLQG